MKCLPRPSSYPLLGPKYPLLGTIFPQLRVQGGSRFWGIDLSRLVPLRGCIGISSGCIGIYPDT